MGRKRDLSIFDAIEELDTQDRKADRKRRKETSAEKKKALEAQSQSKIYNHLLETRILLQRAVNKVAKKDKHVIEGIKQELEISFLSAMEEFENWSETQLKMIANISEEGEVDDVRLQQMKQSIVSTTNGMDELQAYMTKQNQRLSQILQCI